MVYTPTKMFTLQCKHHHQDIICKDWTKYILPFKFYNQRISDITVFSTINATYRNITSIKYMGYFNIFILYYILYFWYCTIQKTPLAYAKYIATFLLPKVCFTFKCHTVLQFWWWRRESIWCLLNCCELNRIQKSDICIWFSIILVNSKFKLYCMLHRYLLS